MENDSMWRMFIRGLKRLLRLLWKFIRSRIRFFIYFFKICKRPRHVHYRNCMKIPDEHNLRPDPYIYSQDWLKARGMSYTWDNPDIEIIDDTNGSNVNRHDLIHGRSYTVHATIHNHSFTVPALDTLVLFSFKKFGINGVTVLDIDSDVIDVPNGGSEVAKINWTPQETGHFCLLVKIVHSHDANILNNLGQHNCDVSSPDEDYVRRLYVKNNRKHAMNIKMVANSYRLPESPMRAKTVEERNSKEYLRRLQAANAPGKFPVPESANLIMKPGEFRLEAGENMEVQIRISKGFHGQINIDAISTTNVLLGGITIIGGLQ